MDCKLLELHLRFRGVVEEKGNIRDQMITLIADYIQKPIEEIDKNCEEIYRINSEYTRIKKYSQM